MDVWISYGYRILISEYHSTEIYRFRVMHFPGLIQEVLVSFVMHCVVVLVLSEAVL